jgi:hypothetical protein
MVWTANPLQKSRHADALWKTCMDAIAALIDVQTGSRMKGCKEQQRLAVKMNK